MFSKAMASLNLGDEMNALIMDNKGNVKTAKVPIPTPKHGELLIKIHRSGIFHDDLVHPAKPSWCGVTQTCWTGDQPLILGHEGVGEIVYIGDGVEDEKGIPQYKVGDRVGIPWIAKTCRNCEWCTTGRETLCKNAHLSGRNVHGTHAEYCVVAASHAVCIPSSLETTQAATMLCAGTTAYAALSHCEATVGEWIAIFGGAGGVGHLAIQFAKSMGLKVIAIEHSAEKVKFCKKMGADFVFNANEKDHSEEILRRTNGGVHSTLIVAPCEDAYKLAFNVARPGSNVLCVSLPEHEVPLDMHTLVMKRLNVQGCLVGSRQQMKEAMQFAAEGKVKTVLTEHPLKNAAEVLKKLGKGEFEGRTVLNVSGEKTTHLEGKVASGSMEEHKQSHTVTA